MRPREKTGLRPILFQSQSLRILQDMRDPDLDQTRISINILVCGHAPRKGSQKADNGLKHAHHGEQKRHFGLNRLDLAEFMVHGLLVEALDLAVVLAAQDILDDLGQGDGGEAACARGHKDNDADEVEDGLAAVGLGQVDTADGGERRRGQHRPVRGAARRLALAPVRAAVSHDQRRPLRAVVVVVRHFVFFGARKSSAGLLLFFCCRN